MAPAATPKEIVQSLYDASAKALQKNEVREKFALIGTDVAPMNPAQLAAFIKSEIAKWAVLVKQAGIQPE
jgi:tripartite-type tricarboxylate transporter receptor subunit TctC